MGLYSLVIPLGITTLVLFIITALFGLKSKIIQPKTRLRIHRIIAVIALCLALFHGFLVLYFNYF